MFIYTHKIKLAQQLYVLCFDLDILILVLPVHRMPQSFKHNTIEVLNDFFFLLSKMTLLIYENQ